MKKTLFGIAIVAAGLFVASCGNKSANNAEVAAENAEPVGVMLSLCNTTYEGDTLMISTDFWYPEDAGVKEIQVFGTYAARKTLADSTDNVKMELYLQEGSSYENNKKTNAERYADTFTEFKVGEYDAYGYEGYKSYTVNILFETISETTLRYLTIELSQLISHSDQPGGKEFFEQNEKVKSIVNSMKYNGVVKKTVEI